MKELTMLDGRGLYSIFRPCHNALWRTIVFCFHVISQDCDKFTDTYAVILWPAIKQYKYGTGISVFVIP